MEAPEAPGVNTTDILGVLSASGSLEAAQKYGVKSTAAKQKATGRNIFFIFLIPAVWRVQELMPTLPADAIPMALVYLLLVDAAMQRYLQQAQQSKPILYIHLKSQKVNSRLIEENAAEADYTIALGRLIAIYHSDL